MRCDQKDIVESWKRIFKWLMTPPKTTRYLRDGVKWRPILWRSVDTIPAEVDDGSGEGKAHGITIADVQHDEGPLDWDEDPSALPYLDKHGELVIPVNCPKKYRWWQGGQSVEATLRELRAEK